jgi:hypothetical protein
MILYALDRINHNFRRKEPIVTRVLCFLGVLLVPLTGLSSVGAEEARTLDIYFLDMMGGGSTLLVTPLGESVLIDTGSLRPEHRMPTVF